MPFSCTHIFQASSLRFYITHDADCVLLQMHMYCRKSYEKTSCIILQKHNLHFLVLSEIMIMMKDI
jgi:hypothetical protein